VFLCSNPNEFDFHGVPEIIGKQSLKVPVVEHDEMIENISMATSNKALGNTVLPQALEGCPCGLYSH